jgi:hypothetical protein
MFFNLLLLLSAAAHLLGQRSFASPIAIRSTASPAIRTVYEFPNETWVENIAVRRNGNLLVTLIGVPEVWEIDAFTSQAELIQSFPDANTVSGISKVEDDVFAVAVGN